MKYDTLCLMNQNISVERISPEGLDITLVTQPGSEALRAAVVVPFDPTDIIQGTMPAETPHMLEHVVLCGYGDTPTDDFKDTLNRFGGYSNGHTHSSINGKVEFETIQPTTDLRRYWHCCELHQLLRFVQMT